MLATRIAPPTWLAAIALVVAARPGEPPAPAPVGPHQYPGACREVHHDLTATGPDEVVTWTYDVLGRPIRRDDSAGSVTLLYRADGRLDRELYPAIGHVEHVYDLAGHEVATRFYEHGKDQPFHTQVRVFEAGRVVEMREDGRVHHYSYSKDGRDVLEQVGRERTTFFYDAADRLVSSTNELGVMWDHRYDDAGNHVEERMYGDELLERVTYTYDCWR